MEELRVSVRELVEFTLHGADIRLVSGRMQDMLDGTLGHQARQKLLGDGWQAEVPLNLPIPVEDEELTLLLLPIWQTAHKHRQIPEYSH